MNSDSTEKASPKKANAFSDLFDDDDDENYTLKDDGPASLDAFFAAALQDSEEEVNSDPAAKVFEDESVLDSELDRAFSDLVENAQPYKSPAPQAVEKAERTEKEEKSEKAPARANDNPSDKKSSDPAPKEPVERVEKAETREKSQDDRERTSKEFSKPTQKDSSIPDWCADVSFPELDSLNSDLVALKKEVSATRDKIDDSSEKLRKLTDLKDALLSLTGARLNHGCCLAFEELGWTVQMSADHPNEILLKTDDEVRAIVRVVASSGPADSKELANLAKSVVRHWNKHDFEPKGILLASTFLTETPQERSQDNFTKSMAYFAERKNLSLLTCTQLLSIYLGVFSGSAQKKTVCKNLLGNAGAMPGWKLDSIRME